MGIILHAADYCSCLGYTRRAGLDAYLGTHDPDAQPDPHNPDVPLSPDVQPVLQPGAHVLLHHVGPGLPCPRADLRVHEMIWCTR